MSNKTHARLLKKLADIKLEKIEKYETFSRWRDLPKDFRSKCIEKLDFKTRCQLRCAGKAEKALVDALRFDFDKITLYCGCDITVEWKNLEGEKRKTRVSTNIDRKLGNYLFVLGFLLKRGNIREFFIEETKPLLPDESAILDDLIPIESAKIKNLISDEYNETVLYFLRKCWEEMDSIHIFFNGNQHFFKDIMPIRSFDYVWTFKMSDPASTGVSVQQFIPLIENWIVNNAPLGKKLVAEDVIPETIRHFIIRFGNRLFYSGKSDSHKGHVVRIGSDYPGKHVLATVLEERYIFYCSVIPAETDPSEYDNFIL